MGQDERSRGSLDGAISNGIVVVDARGKVVHANAAACALLGTTHDRLLRHNILTGSWPMVRADGTPLATEERPVAVALRSGQAVRDALVGIRNISGSLIWLLANVEPIFHPDGSELDAVVISYVDITAIREAEELHRESEARFRAIFDRAAIGISLLSLDGQFIETNPAFQQMLGYSESEFRRLFITDIVVPEERPLITAQLGEVIHGRREFYQSERCYRSKDGATVRGNVTVSLVRDGRGASRALIGMVEDITERKRIEEQFHRSQRLEAVGRLAGGLAHDFNNLLTIILGFSDLLRADLDETHPWASYLDEIAQAAERGASLTRQLLAFSRQQVLAPVALDLNSVVTRMQNMLGYLIGKDIAIEADLEPHLRLVKADPGQIEQVILNLAMNARDAMPSGGRLTFATANVQLGEMDARRYLDTAPGAYALLTVRDTGSGMDEEVRSHIFEPFFTTKEPGKGMGLGLPTVYGIVNQSNGQIVVESAPGQGSAFHIYLPSVDPTVLVARPEALLPARRAAGAVAGSETILLVENDAMVRALVQKIATGAGYQVLVAASGDEAIRIAEQHPGAIQLLVTDVVMSGLSGPQVAQRVAERRPETRVLYMSGSTDDVMIRQGVIAADVAFVQKPFKSSTLLQKIREVLGADSPEEEVGDR